MHTPRNARASFLLGGLALATLSAACGGAPASLSTGKRSTTTSQSSRSQPARSGPTTTRPTGKGSVTTTTLKAGGTAKPGAASAAPGSPSASTTTAPPSVGAPTPSNVASPGAATQQLPQTTQPPTPSPTTTTQPPPPPPTTTTVPPVHTAISISAFAFHPSTVSVPVGSTVTVTNNDAPVTHSWTATGGAFNSGPLAPGVSYSFTFTQPGTYNFVCTFHSFMTGTVTVTG